MFLIWAHDMAKYNKRVQSTSKLALSKLYIVIKMIPSQTTMNICSPWVINKSCIYVIRFRLVVYTHSQTGRLADRNASGLTHSSAHAHVHTYIYTPSLTHTYLNVHSVHRNFSIILIIGNKYYFGIVQMLFCGVSIVNYVPSVSVASGLFYWFIEWYLQEWILKLFL